MKVIIHDLTGKEHIVECDEWGKEENRYVFYDNRRIVAVYQMDGIIGFTVKR